MTNKFRTNRKKKKKKKNCSSRHNWLLITVSIFANRFELQVKYSLDINQKNYFRLKDRNAYLPQLKNLKPCPIQNESEGKSNYNFTEIKGKLQTHF